MPDQHTPSQGLPGDIPKALRVSIDASIKEAQQKRRGYIRVDAREPFLSIPTDNLAAWHTALLLPDAYEIEFISSLNHNGNRQGWNVYVQHERIPTIEDYTPMPEVLPRYAINESGFFLDHIEIASWNHHKACMEVISVTDKRAETAV